MRHNPLTQTRQQHNSGGTDSDTEHDTDSDTEHDTTGQTNDCEVLA